MSSLFYVSTCCRTIFTNLQYAQSFSLQSPPSNASFKLMIRSLACIRNTGQQPENIVTRRSGNYPPPLWDDRFIQSLTSVYNDETHIKKADKLKKDVRLMILQSAARPLDQLDLIEDIQRLGLSYHFEDIIETTLKKIFVKFNDDHKWMENDLYNTSRQFRLFRDQGFHVSQDVFVEFMDESGDFKQSLSSDTKGLLSLYEASHLSIEGETMLDQARDFSTKHLVNNLRNNEMDDVLALQVKNALEIPLHWRMLRDQARWFIQLNEQTPGINHVLLELAKLDFNLVQSTHQRDLKIMSRWWIKTGLGQKLPFARDRLTECFLWSIGIIFEPEQRYCRQMLTKINVLLTTIDDVYDVYGTLDELELFTDAVERWDINTMDRLPDYMKICFLALFNSINEMAYDALKEHGYNAISDMKNAWLDLCKSYLLEARWYYSGYKPTLDEYLNNAWISISAPVILAHVYFFVTKTILKEAYDCIETTSAVIRCSSLIFRLADDLATSSDEMKRGDVPKSIQCYMNETGATEDEARAHIRSLINETWKKMNKERFKENCHFSKTFIGAAMNLGRVAQFMYQHGDGHGGSSNVTRDRVLRLLVEPICLDEHGDGVRAASTRAVTK